MIVVDRARTPRDLVAPIERMFERSASKIRALEASWQVRDGAPVFTVDGRYCARGWTEWTQGFQFGSALLQFDATGEREFLELGRSRTLERMAPHLTHVGVHDHGFNNVSTYGALLRLAREGRIEPCGGARGAAPAAAAGAVAGAAAGVLAGTAGGAVAGGPECDWERRFYALALSVSGAVQARRWTRIPTGGFIYSFNGPHSLFVDTIRSLRALSLAHLLGHRLVEEQDAPVSLLERLIQHARATADFNVWFGRGRDAYDLRGRVAHEGIFNTVNGSYRGPNSQQGFSPFTTWTRGLAWAMLGYAEQIEFLAILDDAALEPFGGRATVDAWMLDSARATCDFYIDRAAAADGVPYWDTGAPGLAALGAWGERPADPFNDHEPVDSSAAAIGVQGLLRLGHLLTQRGEDGERYTQAGLRTLATLLDESGPYVSPSASHQGLLLHAVYHRPNGWDYIPPGARTPRGESCQWGDYHLREAALYVLRLAKGEPYLTFFGPAW